MLQRNLLRNPTAVPQPPLLKPFRRRCQHSTVPPPNLCQLRRFLLRLNRKRSQQVVPQPLCLPGSQPGDTGSPSIRHLLCQSRLYQRPVVTQPPESHRTSHSALAPSHR
uniref:(northern house mosquito) hypothetical protein n=1 Tax=Culex pipiens TaxID=7175 RepID=A0A8D8HIU0_CULPI